MRGRTFASCLLTAVASAQQVYYNLADNEFYRHGDMHADFHDREDHDMYHHPYEPHVYDHQYQYGGYEHAPYEHHYY